MRVRCLLAAFVVLACATGAVAQKPAAGSRGTPAEADALLKQAVAHYEKVGRAPALADFTAKKAPFADRDLYVFCYGPDGKTSAHGADPKLVGVPYDTLKDVDGKAFGTELWKVGSRPGGGTVEYKWKNPVSAAIETKISVVRKVGDDVCGVGAYKPGM